MQESQSAMFTVNDVQNLSFAERKPPKCSLNLDFEVAKNFQNKNIASGSYLNHGQSDWNQYSMNQYSETSPFPSSKNIWSPAIPMTPDAFFNIQSFASQLINETQNPVVNSSFQSPTQSSFWSTNAYYDQNQMGNNGNSECTSPGSPIPVINTRYKPPRTRRRRPNSVECTFCKNNGEDIKFYRSHILKDPEGIIMCPILRRYNCPVCKNNGGNYAHTLRYCPANRPGGWHKAMLIKSSMVNAAENGGSQ